MSAKGVFVRGVVVIFCAWCPLITATLRAEERPLHSRTAGASLTPSASVCSASGKSLPPNIRIDRYVLPRVEKMLERSRTFREQCRRLAAVPWVHVGVKLDPRVFETRSYRALSVIQRPQPSLMIAMITLQVLSDPAVWLAHEFEHILEQVDEVDLEALADRKHAAWRVGPHMFETKRAIAAGDAVSDEVRRGRTDDGTAVASVVEGGAHDHDFVD